MGNALGHAQKMLLDVNRGEVLDAKTVSECAIQSLPASPSIASLGRGIQNLREASKAVMQTEGTRVQKSIESFVNSIITTRDQ